VEELPGLQDRVAELASQIARALHFVIFEFLEVPGFEFRPHIC
jgi:hypothetical protein